MTDTQKRRRWLPGILAAETALQLALGPTDSPVFVAIAILESIEFREAEGRMLLPDVERTLEAYSGRKPLAVSMYDGPVMLSDVERMLEDSSGKIVMEIGVHEFTEIGVRDLAERGLVWRDGDAVGLLIDPFGREFSPEAVARMERGAARVL